MLVKVLRGDSIATRRRLTRKGNVTFEDLMRGTSDFEVRTVTIEGLTSVRYLLPIPVGIVTVIATMRSTGLSWSHDTCCVDGEIGSLSNESISELLPSGVGRYRTAFLYERKALSSRHPRWRWLYLQQVFGAMPRRSGSHWRPGHVVAVARLDRTGPSTRDLLNTLAAITCTRPASDPSATRGPTRRSRTDLPRAIRRRFACGAQRAPLRSRGLSSPKVRHCQSGMITFSR